MNLRREEMETDIQSVLDAHRFAVLATQRGGQPHTSLVAYTRLDGIRRLLFATYRATRKFQSLHASHRVALFIGDPTASSDETLVRSLLTAHGIASEVAPDKWATFSREHKRRHPNLETLIASPDAALVSVEVASYQLVRAIDEAQWLDVTDAA